MPAEPFGQPSRLVRIAADDGGELPPGSHQTGHGVVQVAYRGDALDGGLPVAAAQRQHPHRALGGRPGEGVRHRDLLEVAQREQHQGGRAVDGDELADLDPALAREYRPVPDQRDQQNARQQHLHRRDQRPHPGAAHGGPANLLGGAAVAAEEKFLAADPTQHAQSGDRVRGQLGGLARLVPLLVGAPRGGRQQRQHGQGEHRHGERHQQAEGREVENQADADHHEGGGRGGETGERLDEPADLLHVAGRDGDDLAGRDPPRQRRAQLGGLAGEQLLDAGGGGDPVGHGGPVQHGVAEGEQDAEHHGHAAGQREPPSGAVDDGLDGETHGDREPGDAQLVQQPPAEGLELAAELVAPEPVQEAGA